MSGKRSRSGSQYRDGFRTNNSQIRNPNTPLELFVRQPYFDMIIDGRKTIEGRAAYKWLDRAKAGARLDFRQNQFSLPLVHTVVDWTLRAPTFEEALLEVTWQDAVPNVGHFDKALAVYDRIYPPEKIQDIGGALLIGFTVQSVVHGRPRA